MELPEKPHVLVYFLSTLQKLGSSRTRNLNYENASIGLGCRQVCREIYIIDTGGVGPLWTPLFGQLVMDCVKKQAEQTKSQAVGSVSPWPSLQFLPEVPSLASLNGGL